MARAGVTYSDIANAAQAVRERGHEPTVDRVREHLGTGSKSTIGPLLKRWREQNGEAVDASGLPGDLVEVIRALYERLQRTADERIDQARTELQGTIIELRGQLAEAKASLAQSQEANTRLETQWRAASSENEALKSQLQQAELEATKVQSQRDEAWSRIGELKTALDEQKRDARAAQERFEHYQQRTAEERQNERDEFRLASQHYQNQIQQLLDQTQRSDVRYGELQAEHKTQRHELETQRSEFQSLNERHATIKADTESLMQRLKEVVAERDEIAKRADLAQERAASLASEAASARTKAGFVEQQLEEVRRELQSANDKVEALVDQNRLASEEKAALQGQLKQIQASL